MYTSVTQNTVTAVLSGFEKLHPGVKVSVFRATTGQLNARIAADQHSGGLRADVIWGTDPLSMESYAQDGLFRPWPLPNLTGVPARDQAKYFWGTRELYLVIVAHKSLTPMPKPGPTSPAPATRARSRCRTRPRRGPRSRPLATSTPRRASAWVSTARSRPMARSR